MIAVRNFTIVYAKVVALRYDIGMIRLDPNYEGYQYAIDHVDVPKDMFHGQEARVGDIYGLYYSESSMEDFMALIEVRYIMFAGELEAVKYDPKEGGF